MLRSKRVEMKNELIPIKPSELLRNLQIYLPIKASVIVNYSARGNLSEIAEALSLMRQAVEYEKKGEVRDWLKYGIFVFLALIGLGALYILVVGSGGHTPPTPVITPTPVPETPVPTPVQI